MELFGVRSDETDAWIGVKDEPEFFEIWPENELVLNVFLAMGDQWIWTGGMESSRAGLNLAALPIVYEGLEVPPERRPEIFRELQGMSRAALMVWNESRA